MEPDEMNEIWALYADDGGQALDQVEEALLVLKDHPTDAAAIGSLFRGMHTFKGNSRILGLSVSESRAHLAEDLIGLVRDEGVPLDAELYGLLMEAADALRGMLENTIATRRDAAADVCADLAARMRAKYARCKGVAEAPAAVVPTPEAPASIRAEVKPEPGKIDAQTPVAPVVEAPAPEVPAPAAPEASAPEAPAPVAPAPTEPAAEPESILFEPVSEDVLGGDPVYRAIFMGMAQDAVTEMRAALDRLDAEPEAARTALTEEADRLRHAAAQIGMSEWLELLTQFTAEPPLTRDAAAALIGRLVALQEREAGGAAEEAAPEAVAPAQAPAAPSEAAPVGAILFEPVTEATLGGDPVYREIFMGMAQDAITEMCAALGRFDDEPEAARTTLTEEAEHLHHAATQIGMTEWLGVLAEFTAEPPLTRDGAATLIGRLAALRERGQDALKSEESDAAAASDEPMAAFFRALEPHLAELAELDPLFATKVKVEPERFAKVAAAIKELTAPYGFDQLGDIAGHFPGACGQPRELRHFLFRFYEELALIEEAAIAEHSYSHIHAGANLRSWCADRVFETIIELNAAMDEVRQQKTITGNCQHIAEMLRQVHFACQHYDIETAGHLAMALVDLFERVLSGEIAADPVLLQVFRSFIASLEMVFSTASAGQAPDLAGIETLLHEAEKVPFIASGTVPSSSIEARLGLPKSFHRVLTPESVKTAVASLDAGHRFYIVSADLDRHPEVAEAFLNWIASGGATIITNVTKFGAVTTAFDFLLASPLAEAEFAEMVARLDPVGDALRLEMALTDRKAGQPGGAETGGAGAAAVQVSGAVPASGDLMSRNMLASIGEIVTGHAQVRHLLTGFAKDDPMQIIEAEMLAADGNWRAAREGVRHRLRGWQDRVERLQQVEAQLADRLDRLQEEAIAVRTRPAALLIKPLVAFGETLARNHHREVAITTAGDDVALDSSMLENFKAPLHALLSFAVTESIEPGEHRREAGKSPCGKVHIALARLADHIAVTIEDDGAGFEMTRIAERARELGWTRDKPSVDMVLRDGFGKIATTGGEGVDLAEVRNILRHNGGDLRLATRPGGGVSYRATLPLAMVVLDGMVVRVGEVMYVVPIDAIQLIVHPDTSAMMKVSAGDGSYMLRLENNDVLPVRFLMRTGEHGGFGLVNGGSEFLTGGADGAQKRLFVVAGSEACRVALSIDELIGQQMVLIRPLQGYLAGIRGVSGCALLGSGDVGMVLDMGFVLSQSGAAAAA